MNSLICRARFLAAVPLLVLTISCSTPLEHLSTLVPSPAPSVSQKSRSAELVVPGQTHKLPDDRLLEQDATPSLNLNAAQLTHFNAFNPRRLVKSQALAPTQSQPAPFTTDPRADADGYGFDEYYNGQHFEGVTAYNTLWTSIIIPGGTDGYGTRALYAPTMKPPRSCLEVSNQYLNGSQYVAVYDFCENGGQYVVSKQASSEFSQTYIRSYYGNPQAGIQTVLEYSKSFDPYVVTACPTYSAQCDVAAIYNYITNRYDVLYARNEGNTNGVTQGWDQIETHFEAGFCPLHPDIYAIEINLYDANSHQDVPGTTSNSYRVTPYLSDGCFARGIYQFNPYAPNTSWQSIAR